MEKAFPSVRETFAVFLWKAKKKQPLGIWFITDTQAVRYICGLEKCNADKWCFVSTLWWLLFWDQVGKVKSLAHYIEEFPWVCTTPLRHRNLCIYRQKMNWFKTKNIFLPWCLFSFFSLALSDLHFIGVDQISLACHCTGMQGAAAAVREFFFLNLTCYSAIPTPGREPEWLKQPFFLCPSSCCNFLWAWK